MPFHPFTINTASSNPFISLILYNPKGKPILPYNRLPNSSLPEDSQDEVVEEVP
jgi:hypothetical protein